MGQFMPCLPWMQMIRMRIKDGELEQKYLDYIVEKEKDDGGFSLDDNATNGDVDLTAMTLQCLEPYQDETM